MTDVIVRRRDGMWIDTPPGIPDTGPDSIKNTVITIKEDIQFKRIPVTIKTGRGAGKLSKRGCLRFIKRSGNRVIMIDTIDGFRHDG